MSTEQHSRREGKQVSERLSLTSKEKQPGNDSEPEEEEEDATSIFESSIFSLFDIHMAASGDPGRRVKYTHERLKTLINDSTLKYYIPKGDKEHTGLMAQFQWDSGLVLADLFCENSPPILMDSDQTTSTDTSYHYFPFDVRDKTTLELGAGTGLPSLVVSLLASRTTVITDYPSPDVLETLKKNIKYLDSQVKEARSSKDRLRDSETDEGVMKSFVEGLEWGKRSHEKTALRSRRLTDLDTVLLPLNKTLDQKTLLNSKRHLDTPNQGFDLLLTTDTLWLSKSHKSLIKTLKRTLKYSSNSRIFLVAGFHTGRILCSNFFERLFSLGSEELTEYQEQEITIDQESNDEDEEEIQILNRRLIPDQQASKFGGIWERSFQGEERNYLDWNENWISKKIRQGNQSEETQLERDAERLKMEELNDDRDERAKWCVIACLKWEMK